MVGMTAKFDLVAVEHVQRIQKNNMPHYFGEKIQIEVILVVVRKIKERILEMLKSCKYYSVTLDSTPDFIHQEQFIVIVRFIFLMKIQGKSKFINTVYVLYS
jgi:hypothetical protein